MDLSDPARFGPGDDTFYGRYVSFDGSDARAPPSGDWDMRYLSGGLFSGGTDLLVWRDTRSANVRPTSCGVRPPWGRLGQRAIRLWDEDGSPFAPPAGKPFPDATQRVKVGSPGFPAGPAFGRIELDLWHDATTPAQAWVSPVLSALGRFSVGFDAERLDDLCGVSPFNPRPAQGERTMTTLAPAADPQARPSPTPPAEPPPRIALRASLLAVLLVLVLAGAVAVATAVLESLAEGAVGLATFLAQPAALLAAGWLAMRSVRLRAADYLPWTVPGRAVWAPAIALGVGVILLDLTLGAPLLVAVDPEYSRMIQELYTSTAALVSPVGLWLLAGALVPLCEEFLFRGVILRSLLDRWRVWPAILVSSAVFALFHLHPVHMLMVFPLGIAAGWAMVVTRSLWTAVAVHAAANSVAIGLGLAVPSLDAAPLWMLIPAAAMLVLGVSGLRLTGASGRR